MLSSDFLLEISSTLTCPGRCVVGGDGNGEGGKGKREGDEGKKGGDNREERERLKEEIYIESSCRQSHTLWSCRLQTVTQLPPSMSTQVDPGAPPPPPPPSPSVKLDAVCPTPGSVLGVWAHLQRWSKAPLLSPKDSPLLTLGLVCLSCFQEA